MPDLSRLRDVDTPESRVLQSVATGAFTALVSPAKLSRGTRTTMHAFSGLLGAGAGAFVLAGQMPPAQRAVAAVTLGASLYGASALGVVADTKAEQWLRDRGVRRPRLVLGLAAGVLTWFTSAPTESREALDTDMLDADLPDTEERDADSR